MADRELPPDDDGQDVNLGADSDDDDDPFKSADAAPSSASSSAAAAAAAASPAATISSDTPTTPAAAATPATSAALQELAGSSLPKGLLIPSDDEEEPEAASPKDEPAAAPAPAVLEPSSPPAAAKTAPPEDEDLFGKEDDEALFGKPEPKKEEPKKEAPAPTPVAAALVAAPTPVAAAAAAAAPVAASAPAAGTAALTTTAAPSLSATSSSSVSSVPKVDAIPKADKADALPAKAPAPLPVATDDDDAPPRRDTASKAAKPLLSSEPVEGGDDLKLEVTVSDPERVGDGMSAYIVYKVHSKSSLPSFKQSETTVMRRFSDFFSLRGLLVEKYPGIIVAQAPPKDAIGTGVMKFKNAGNEVTPFIERRTFALSRFLQRIASHPVLRQDDQLRIFLESDDRLPKPKSSVIASMAAKLSSFVESDEWFDDKAREIDSLESQLKKTHAAIEMLVSRRRDLSSATKTFADSLTALAAAEEVPSLTRALNQLGDVEAKVALLHTKQANRDFYDFSEILDDYLGLIESIKECFTQRSQAFKAWQAAEANLIKKRENETKIKQSGKTEKLDQATRDVTTAEELVASTKKEFETITKRLKQDITRFDGVKVQDFQKTLVEFVETMMTTQHQTMKAWEQFLPEAKSIGTA